MQVEIQAPETKFPRYISATQISHFLDCPLKYKIIYSGEVQRLPPNLYILYGSAIHHALEINYKQKVTSRVDLPLNVAIELFVNFFADEAQKEL